MSAVVNAVSSVASAIVDVVGDVVETVVDVVDTVVTTVGNVVQAVIDDPLPTLLAIGGQMVGIPMPLTMATITAAKGGDLGDIVLSAGTAYFAPQVGSAISSTVSSQFIEMGFNETFSSVASSSISRGLVSGTLAEVKGGSFDDGFSGGFVGGMVSGGVNEIGSYVKDDVILLAEENGLDLKDATSFYNAGKTAVSAGVNSEITGRGDFLTSFTNSAIGSGVDVGVRSINNSIDEEFKTAALYWDEQSPEEEKIDLATTGAGIPSDLVASVELSSDGFDTQPENFGAIEAYDFDLPPAVELASAPDAESAEDFVNIFSDYYQTANKEPISEDNDYAYSSPQDRAEFFGPQEDDQYAVSSPEVDYTDVGDFISSTRQDGAVIDDAELQSDLLATGFEPDAPTGGLQAVSVAPEDKMAEAQGLNVTDFTAPLVSTFGNILKQTLAQGKKKPPRPAPIARPAGGLKMARAPRPVRQSPPSPVGSRPPAPLTMNAPPPQQVDLADLTPIERAAPPRGARRQAPAQTLPSTAKLTPITNIASLTSLLEKTG